MSVTSDLSRLQAGGSEEEAALTTLEKQLICPICLELFHKPVVILPCQHNLCRKCANELYQPSLFQARTTMSVHSGRFRCPTCGQEVILDRHGVFGLQRNLLVENIIDVYKQEVSNNNNHVPSLLPPPPPPAPPPSQLTCSDHEDEKVNIFCLSCKVSTCSLCKVFGKHQACQVAPLSLVYQQQKEELSEGVGSLVQVNDRIQTLINELEETCRQIEENAKAQKQNVCDHFSSLTSFLGERHKAMTQQIASEQEEKTGHVQSLVRCYGDSVDANAKLMERGRSSMEETDTAAFVQSSRELVTLLITASSSCPTEALTPGFENLSPYRFNFSSQEKALRSIDFNKVEEEVPEEPDVEPESEEPNQPALRQETAEHQEPVPEKITEPREQAPIPPGAPEPAEEEEGDSADEGSGGRKKKKEEEEEEKDKEEDEQERSAAPVSVKERNVSERQEGMSTQQCEGGGAKRNTGDWTTQRAGEEEREGEEEIQRREETDVQFFPGRNRQEVKPEFREKVPSGASGLEEDLNGSDLKEEPWTERGGEEVLSKSEIQGEDGERETRDVLQAVTLLFYLLAFLLILQRVWAYFGCFICT